MFGLCDGGGGGADIPYPAAALDSVKRGQRICEQESKQAAPHEREQRAEESSTVVIVIVILVRLFRTFLGLDAGGSPQGNHHHANPRSEGGKASEERRHGETVQEGRYRYRCDGVGFDGVQGVWNA